MEFLNDKVLFNTLAGLFTIGLSIVAFLMRNWWAERLIKMRDSSSSDPRSSLFRSHMKKTTVEKAKRETSLAAVVMLVIGLVMIFLL